MSDKAVVQRCQASFDVIVLQANLAVSAPRGLASWQDLERPFWIDPIAYAFAAAPAYLMSDQKVARGSEQKERRYKRTFLKLAEKYGEPFTTAVSNQRSLVPNDFSPEGDKGVASRVLEWQRTVLRPSVEDLKYLAYPELEPVLLTVPFFPLQPPVQGPAPGWLDVNLRLARAALDLYPSERLALGLLVEDSLFDEWQRFEPTLEAYLEVPINDIWFWISENEEVGMTLPRAKAMLEVVRRARERGKRVHQAFGGSFSSLLLREGLASIGHGLTYWERKGWEPLAAGGIPTVRYFYPPLRERLPVPLVATAFESIVNTPAEFHEFVCGCTTCRGVVSKDVADFGAFGEVDVRTRVNRNGTRIQYDAPTATALRLNKAHYLEAKEIEIRTLLQPDFDPVATLDGAADRHRSPVISTRHLALWVRALTEPFEIPV